MCYLRLNVEDLPEAGDEGLESDEFRSTKLKARYLVGGAWMLINGGDPALGIASNNDGVPRRGFRQCKAGAVGCRGTDL